MCHSFVVFIYYSVVAVHKHVGKLVVRSEIVIFFRQLDQVFLGYLVVLTEIFRHCIGRLFGYSDTFIFIESVKEKDLCAPQKCQRQTDEKKIAHQYVVADAESFSGRLSLP